MLLLHPRHTERFLIDRPMPGDRGSPALVRAVKRRLMSTPHEEIENFLIASGTDLTEASDVALEFARCMCDELHTALAQWEAEMKDLLQTEAAGASHA